MPRSYTFVRTACLLLWPLALYADALDVPQLGLKFASLPDGVSKPLITEAAAGHEVLIQLGKASLRVYRDNGAVPAGSDVASPAYRARLDAKFGKRIESTDQGAPTAVGGHGAWTVVEARPTGTADTAYTCLTYVIAEQHLYRLTVDAEGITRPQEFDALVKALSGISFEPVSQI
jgi:hypothetical protein